ncbi:MULTISPECIES: DUF805 domain-containing protein [Arthrobacter]|uniref:DUF805 domain-containing protein n=2 Tax=Arthrobacter TaxID=1663 RepID=A0ABU9KJV2_9MICC|nr:DUF805 domain-containing protein [Arthrobacter sp. YJM1]MDP5227153.1 DUF805 domain-containing protein [Arthrobacter sp. YJM1]
MTQQPERQDDDGGRPPQGQQPYRAQHQPQQPPQYGQSQPGARPPQPPSPYGQPSYSGGLYAPFVPRPRVGFVDAIKLGFANYANFKGRAGRSEFWWWYLFRLIVVGIPAGIGYGMLLGGIVSQLATDRQYGSGYGTAPDVVFTGAMGAGTVLMVIGLIIELAILLPDLAITWRRLHDGGFPGPMFFLAFIPGVGGIIVLVLTILPSKPEGMKYEAQ